MDRDGRVNARSVRDGLELDVDLIRQRIVHQVTKAALGRDVRRRSPRDVCQLLIVFLPRGRSTTPLSAAYALFPRLDERGLLSAWRPGVTLDLTLDFRNRRPVQLGIERGIGFRLVAFGAAVDVERQHHQIVAVQPSSREGRRYPHLGQTSQPRVARRL
jgi:hypothetical protein